MERWIVVGLLSLSASLFASSHSSGAFSREAMTRLEEGNRRFVSGSPTQCTKPSAKREVLSEGQHPFAVVLSCSDSRVPPEMIFDQGLGDLFVIRVAGNVAESSELASIEYAVEHLKPRLLLVLGHSSCGAVKAAIATPRGTSAGSPSLDRLVETISAHLTASDRAAAKKDPTLKAAVLDNVSGVASDLMGRSKIVKGRVEAGELAIAKGYYDLRSGKVELF